MCFHIIQIIGIYAGVEMVLLIKQYLHNGSHLQKYFISSITMWDQLFDFKNYKCTWFKPL